MSDETLCRALGSISMGLAFVYSINVFVPHLTAGASPETSTMLATGSLIVAVWALSWKRPKGERDD
jgi:hypothetical protein